LSSREIIVDAGQLLPIFLMGYITGRYFVPGKEIDFDMMGIVKSFHVRDSEDLIDRFHIYIFRESSWEIAPSYYYMIGDPRIFEPKTHDPLITPEFLLIKSGSGHIAGVASKEHPKELLFIYNCHTYEKCDNWQMNNPFVIEKMLYELCREINDYSYYMESSSGIIITESKQ